MTPKTFETPSSMSRENTPFNSNTDDGDIIAKDLLGADLDKEINDELGEQNLFHTKVGNLEEEKERTGRTDKIRTTPNSTDSTISTRSISKHSLDSFLHNYTSEDNYSFQEIIDNAAIKLKQKFAVLYKEEDRSKERLAQILQLPSIEQQLMLRGSEEEGNKMRTIETWKYENKNSIMYIPEGVELSAEEQRKMSVRRQIIQHHATRLNVNPFSTEVKSKQNLETTSGMPSTSNDQQKLTETLPLRSYGGSRICDTGFRLVSTPSPCPGEAFSPLMTWGEIEGTPFRLDGMDTPLLHHSLSGVGSASRSGAATPSSFRINATPRREVIAHELAERIGEKMRAQKQKAMDAARRNINGGIGSDHSLASSSPLTSFNRGSRRDRLASMSPAAQRLATNKLGVRMTPIECKTPLTPKLSYSITRKYEPNKSISRMLSGREKDGVKHKYDSPFASSHEKHGEESGKTPSHCKTDLQSSTPNLTDDLLKLPNQRLSAADFF